SASTGRPPTETPRRTAATSTWRFARGRGRGTRSTRCVSRPLGASGRPLGPVHAELTDAHAGLLHARFARERIGDGDGERLEQLVALAVADGPDDVAGAAVVDGRVDGVLGRLLNVQR